MGELYRETREDSDHPRGASGRLLRWHGLRKEAYGVFDGSDKQAADILDQVYEIHGATGKVLVSGGGKQKMGEIILSEPSEIREMEILGQTVRVQGPEEMHTEIWDVNPGTWLGRLPGDIFGSPNDLLLEAEKRANRRQRPTIH